MATKRALVLGGTGMLAGCTAALVADGWHVVLPSRRYEPLTTDLPADDDIGRARWVEADWSRPDDLARRAARALGGPADLLVAWMHGPCRVPMLRAVEPLLRPDAPVIEVHGIGDQRGAPDTVLANHPTQHVVLGVRRYAGRTRWLTADEITDGVLAGLRRALAGRAPAIQHVGEARAHAS
ncbi:Rossmann-fold NAD(P)-binding domain-containing protein [Actinokineospora iranica]|uniref:Short chain dehydrogenase n=1 Tax=Actinokineospora iranica TaxID=1271860 RepID=A0A1G6JNM9_9PSEU|nr:hypothetical protein [Actinokineospora iranica]SDC19566.1 hypothetical protein SAMN05216174_101463 [Actinokineospora iranica]